MTSVVLIVLLSIAVHSIHALGPCLSNDKREKRDAACLPLVDSLPPDVTFVWALIKQGDHNPDTFFSPTPTTYGLEGTGQLSEAGKRQAYGYGQALRQLVNSSFLSNDVNYFPADFQGYSASSGYDQQTLQLAMAGFYPPTGFANWNPSLQWSPVPYAINDSLLGLAPANCPMYNAGWQPIDDETIPEYVAAYAANKPLIDYIAQNTGWNSSIATAILAADNVHEIQLNNAAYPSWIANPTLPGFTQESIVAAISSFYYFDSITCSNYPPCRNLEGVSLVTQVVDTFVGLGASNPPQPNQLNLFVSHTEEVLSTIHLTYVRRDNLPDAGGVVYLYRPTPVPASRVLLSEPIDEFSSEHIFYQAEYLPERAAICDPDYFCPLAAIALLDTTNSGTRETACGDVECL